MEGKDTPLWRDQAQNLAYSQNLAVGGVNVLKYLSHQFGK